MAAAADDAPAGETDKQRIERLENMVEELSRRLDDRDRQEDAAGRQRQEEQANGQGEAVAGGQRKPSNHSLELYGFAQFDAIQDFDRVNPDWEATLRPSRIPTVEGQYRQRRPVDPQRQAIAPRREGRRRDGRQAL